MGDGADEFDAAARDYNIEQYYRSVNYPIRAAYRGEALRVGESCPPFRMPTVDGDVVDSAELRRDANIALVFGCHSEVVLHHEIGGLEQISRALGPETRMIFVYTREIHPDEAGPSSPREFPRHRSMAQKVDQARVFRDEYGLTMTVCVDDLTGSVHQAYGSLPSCQVVIDRSGQLVHRSEWASASLLASVLENMTLRERLERIGRPRISYSETLWCIDDIAKPR